MKCPLIKPEVFLIGTLPDEGAVTGWLHSLVPSASEAWLLTERVPGVWVDDADRVDALRFVQVGEDMDIRGFARGYFFAEGFEARWEPGAGGLRVRYVGEPLEREEGLSHWQGDWPTDVEVIDAEYRLWGRRVRGDLKGEHMRVNGPYTPFASARIPRVVYYPTSNEAEHVSLMTREYREAASGVTWLWRLAGVKEHK